MVVKILVFTSLMLTTSIVLGQQKVSLQLYDYSSTENQPVQESRIVVDSMNLVLDRPAFHSSDPVVYYIASVEKNSLIISYNFNTGERKTIARSPQPLLNPQLTADQKFISCLQREGDKNQLVKFPIAGGDPVVLSRDVDFLSHLWIDDNALLAVEDGDPNTLLLMTIRPRKSVPIANHVGETLQKGKDIFAFVHKLSVDSWSVKKIMSNGSIDIMGETLPESDLFAVTPDGRIIAVYENELFISAEGEYKEIPFTPANDSSQVKAIGFNSTATKFYILTKNQE